MFKSVYIKTYRKVPKFSDTHQLYSKHPKLQHKRFYHGVISPNDVIGIANSEDPDKKEQSGLGLHCWPRTYVGKLGIVTVIGILH